MTAAGYHIVARHWTQSKQETIRSTGADPMTEFPYNIVFARAAATPETRLASPSLAQAG